ncbi:hypothetical protein H072_700 [Dactylellina haptotyla CBS 200.50]|uniref:RNA-binding S4 domain-containing protein n=1 Tax=Dactylellina haptotyla (strain CBS 200.50) TaxID=1284197 RepID=S8C0P2_DACHA|nr:hypothetical protein H072_700 [Dactylellina haptotyla CBS 200.50]
MARNRLYALKRPYPRQSWNKHNVYNIYRYRLPSTNNRTFFQQKFKAKQETRRFHGEYLTERKWNSMFRHTLRGVVRMNPAEMAANDGSSAVAGRGSGLDINPIFKRGMKRTDAHEPPIPFAQMTFAPLERRLDTAVYRALFASSVRQARMMCLHGKVSVNGVKMPHAGYMLNPGDMFSIDPVLVMKAIGTAGSRVYTKLSEKAKEDLQIAIEEAQSKKKSSTYLKRDDKKVLAGNTKAEIEGGVIASASSAETPDENAKEGESETAPTEGDSKVLKLPHDWRTYLPKYPRWKLYDTWEPKRFMNLFAFIPRYLEVNHNICHAVYLRHPVARSGSAEVPNPFNHETMMLAYNWYLRRR